MSKVAQALTIAGSDSGGGAGIQADLKTFQMRGVFGTSVITAVTAQNTLGVFDIQTIPLQTIQSQLKAIADDFTIGAFKIGMLGTAEIIECVAEVLNQYHFGSLVLDQRWCAIVATKCGRFFEYIFIAAGRCDYAELTGSQGADRRGGH